MRRADRLDLLRREIGRLNHHHDAFWAEIRHFSWLLSIVVGGPILFYLDSKPVGETSLAFGGVFTFGVMLSIVAFVVLRGVSKQFMETMATVARLERLLGIHDQIQELADMGYEDPYLY